MDVPTASLQEQDHPVRRSDPGTRSAHDLASLLVPRSPLIPPDSSRASRWHDLASLAFLLLLATSLRVWLMSHTEVTARDSIGFIRYAWQLERQPWAEVLRHSQQHPGYPVWLLAVSWPVHHYWHGDPASAMQWSAQFASAIAGVLLVIPMFYLGKEIFDRWIGFWGALLFQCLPVSAHILSDALSEATFLLLTTLALLCAVRALRGSSALRFGLCGLFCGLSYLTRPEGALLLASTALVLLAMQALLAWRRSWQQLGACAASMMLTALVVSLPYIAVIQHFTTKPTGLELLKSSALGTETLEKPRLQHSGRASAGTTSVLAASVLAVWATETEKGSVAWSVRALVLEVIKGYYYLAWLPALVGVWWFRERLRSEPGAWVPLLLCLLHGLVLLRLAMVMGYVSERHVLVLVLCGIFWAAALIQAFGSWLSSCFHSQQPIAVLFLLALACSGLPQSLKPLHANRAGHHAAGLWLASHTLPADPITDPFCWAHYYAGRVFWEGLTPPVPPGHQLTEYVVVERTDREHSRLPLIAKAMQLAERGQLVYHWPEDRATDKADVFVYAVPTP